KLAREVVRDRDVAAAVARDPCAPSERAENRDAEPAGVALSGERDDRYAHVKRFAGRGRPGVGVGVEGDVDASVAGEVAVAIRARAEQLDPRRIDAVSGEPAQDAAPEVGVLELTVLQQQTRLG